VGRAKSFMTFLSKWTGLDFFKQRIVKRVAMVRDKFQEEEHGCKRARKEKVEVNHEILPLTICEKLLADHAFRISQSMKATNSRQQAVYRTFNDRIEVIKANDTIKLEKTLGVGSFAEVRQAYDMEEGRRVACKIFSTNNLAANSRLRETFAREIGSLKYFNHPNIVRFEGLMVTKDHVCILMELVEGVELFSYIIQKKRLSEAEAKPLLRQLAQTIVFMHTQGIVHRDLKLENVMVVTNKSTGGTSLKIIDFGLSRSDAGMNAMMETRCGSEEYAAPEILRGFKYDPRLSDSWSFGVIMYACLVGALPFNPEMVGDTPVRTGPRCLSSKIIAGRFYLPEHELSREATALARCLLVTDPRHRMSLPLTLRSLFFRYPLTM